MVILILLDIFIQKKKKFTLGGAIEQVLDLEIFDGGLITLL
jgi:hypothetical protein